MNGLMWVIKKQGYWGNRHRKLEREKSHTLIILQNNQGLLRDPLFPSRTSRWCSSTFLILLFPVPLTTPLWTKPPPITHTQIKLCCRPYPIHSRTAICISILYVLRERFQPCLCNFIRKHDIALPFHPFLLLFLFILRHGLTVYSIPGPELTS